MTSKIYELGSGYSYTKYGWSCDRKLNPHYSTETHPDVEWVGIIIRCPHGDGAIHFKIPGHPLFQNGWTVKSFNPLTLSPSILRTECGCHGYIREGKWVNS